MKRRYSVLGKLSYCAVGVSLLLFFAALVSFDSPSEREYDNRVPFFFRDAVVAYTIVAPFCFFSALMSAGNKAYSTAVAIALVPTLCSFCFLLFAIVSENSQATWAMLFAASFGVYPVLYADYKTRKTK